MISINLSELIWTVINFLLLMLLLTRFLLTPIRKVMDARQAKVDAGLEEERRAQARVQENDEKIAAEQARSREEARRILNDSGSAVEQRRSESLAQAQKAAEAARQEAAAELVARREAEERSLDAAQPELAELLAKQLLGEEE